MQTASKRMPFFFSVTVSKIYGTMLSPFADTARLIDRTGPIQEIKTPGGENTLTEKEYFCEQIRLCEKSMYNLAYSILKNEPDAADAMQDAILKAYSNLEQLKDREKFRSWILSIVHHTAIEYIRRRKETVNIDDREDLPSPESALDSAARMTVREAVEKLNLPYRTVILLFYYEQYSAKQIAQVMRSSEIAVKQQLSRGRKMLAKLLNKEDFIQ